MSLKGKDFKPKDVRITLQDMLGSGGKFRCQDLECLMENDAGWDSPVNALMRHYKEAVNILSDVLGKSLYCGVGPMNSKLNYTLIPPPSDSMRTRLITQWQEGSQVIYLSVTSHDADTLRCLKLEVVETAR